MLLKGETLDFVKNKSEYVFEKCLYVKHKRHKTGTKNRVKQAHIGIPPSW